MGKGPQIILKPFTLVQVTSLTRLGQVLPGSSPLHILVQVGEDARLPAPVFQLLQNVTYDENHQAASALVPLTQWTLLS